jgi:hypothetical protein
MRDPRSNMQRRRFEINRPGVITVAEAAQPVAETPHIFLGQTAAAVITTEPVTNQPIAATTRTRLPPRQGIKSLKLCCGCQPLGDMRMI